MLAPDGYRHDTDYARIRQETFIEMMRRAGCQWTWPLTEVTPCAYAPIRAAVKRWLSASEPPTAFFVADGNWVSPVRAALEVLGKRVPQDISLLTYDDVLDAQVAEPPITAVRQPIDRAARRLLEVILDHLEKSPKAVLVNRVAPELVVRESCRPPGWEYAV
jgi:LacI family transcriptional regulator